MKVIRVNDEDGKGFVRGIIGEDVEFVNPLEHLKGQTIQREAIRTKDMLSMKNAFMASMVSDEWYEKKGAEAWQRVYDGILKTEVPKNFIALLESKSKDEQEKLLRGQSLTPDQLGALILLAARDHGYTMSSYTTEKLPKGVNEADLPDIIHVEGDIVEKVGDTPLKDGQLKNIVKQRKVIVSKFLDRGNEWHCFFQTYASLRGEENHNEGQPHFHYISDKWTRDRADVVAAIKSGNYLATSVHIDLLGYGGKE